MIRRPPTFIALDENDIESHLQRIYFRHTLTVEFQQLHLDSESCDETNQSPSFCVSSETDVDIDTTCLSQEGSSYLEPTPRDRSHASTDAVLHTSVTNSCLKCPISNQQSSFQGTTSTGVHLQADRSVDPPRLKVKLALSLQELQHHSSKAPLEETGRENHQPSHTDAIYTPMSIDSRASTPQISFLSCGVSSSPATASVPLRDLTLASTVSYEAVLAERAVSPASAANETGEDRVSHAKIVL